MKQNLRTIEIEEIDDVFIKRHRDRDGFSCLVESIEKIGLIIPITVLAKDDKYQLIKGQGRLEAHKRLGHKQIKAYVIEDMSENEKIENWLVENAVRQHLSPYDRARLIYYEYQRFKDKETVANNLGINKYKIQEAIEFIEKASPNILKKVEDEQISFAPAQKIVSNIKNQESQDSVVALLVQEKLDSKSQEVIIDRAAKLEQKRKSRPQQDPRITVTDLRKDIRFVKEDAQNRKDILSTYENMWRLAVNAISRLRKDKGVDELLSRHNLSYIEEN